MVTEFSQDEPLHSSWLENAERTSANVSPLRAAAAWMTPSRMLMPASSVWWSALERPMQSQAPRS
jgi:hypothetical protein